LNNSKDISKNQKLISEVFITVKIEIMIKIVNVLQDRKL